MKLYNTNAKVLIKKYNRIKTKSKHIEPLFYQLIRGDTEIRPVYKVPNKKTIINVLDEFIKILTILNITFVVVNTSPRKGVINTIINIKTHVTNGDNRTEIPALVGRITTRNERKFNNSKENIPQTI